MIRAEVTEDGVRLVGALPSGWMAYVDRDWLPASSHPVPWIAVAADGTLAWCDGPPVRAPRTAEPDTAAALCLLAVARAATAAIEDLLPCSVEVTGSGLIAHQVRALVRDAAALGGSSTRVEHPRAIVDTTGDADVIVSATRRLADLGTLVLAGENLGRRAEMNLYPDVHVRGLTLVGVASPLHDVELAFTDSDDHLVESWRESLINLYPGAFVPPGATWYRVSG